MKKLVFILFLSSVVLVSGCTNLPFTKGCNEDARMCPDGTFQERNPFNNCEFDPCPQTSQLEIYYSFGVGEKNILDTENNLYIKDMVCDPIKEYEMRLSEEEKNQIYDKILEEGLFNMKEDFTEDCDPLGNCKAVIPSSSFTLKIYLDDETKTIIWNDNYFNEEDEDFKNLRDFEIFMWGLIDKKESELNIEQPRCGYL